jgi:uncharacterized protein (DUF58 family)
MSSFTDRFLKNARAPRHLSITRVGKIFLVVTLGIGLGALNTGNNLLYLVLGFLLSVIVLSGVLSERVLRDLSVRRLLPSTARAGETFRLRYEIRKQNGTAFALKISEHKSTLNGFGWVPHFDSKEEFVASSNMSTDVRGPLEMKFIEVSTFFPFGLFEKSRIFDVSDMMLIWPKRGFSCEAPTESSAQHAGVNGMARFRDGAGDLAGLRPLRVGEDARRVHWKKSASAQTLLRTERERDDRKQFRLALDESNPLNLERSCEESATLCESLIEQGHEVGFSTSTAVMQPAAGAAALKKILDMLAWAGFSK